MKLVKSLIDQFRTLAGIRRVRQVLPAREKPSVGSSIVRDQFRIRVKYAIDEELWRWLAEKGWRLMPLHNNRRRYTMVPERIFVKLLSGDLAQREEVDRRLSRTTNTQADDPPSTR